MRYTVLAFVTLLLLASCDSPPTEPLAAPEADLPMLQSHQQGGPAMWTERMWLDDEEVSVLLQSHRLATPADEGAETPLYVIAPGALGGPPQSQVGFGSHDHTLATRGAIHRIVFVIEPDSDPGDMVLMNAADVDGDGVEDPFTSAAVIEQAVSEGLAVLNPSPVVCPCPVVSRNVPKPEPGS